MPVDDDLATSEPTYEPYKCESGNARWVLKFRPSICIDLDCETDIPGLRRTPEDTLYGS